MDYSIVIVSMCIEDRRLFLRKMPRNLALFLARMAKNLAQSLRKWHQKNLIGENVGERKINPSANPVSPPIF